MQTNTQSEALDFECCDEIDWVNTECSYDFLSQNRPDALRPKTD